MTIMYHHSGSNIVTRVPIVMQLHSGEGDGAALKTITVSSVRVSTLSLFSLFILPHTVCWVW
jgi:hypothetical protein